MREIEQVEWPAALMLPTTGFLIRAPDCFRLCKYTNGLIFF